MAYAKIPKDLTKVKNKIIFNLTRRQLICFGIGGGIGFPLFFAVRDVLGNSNAAMLMIAAMLPACLFAMYEKDGMHLEQILWNIARMKWIRPAVRTYEMEGFSENGETGKENPKDRANCSAPGKRQKTGRRTLWHGLQKKR